MVMLVRLDTESSREAIEVEAGGLLLLLEVGLAVGKGRAAAL